MRAPFLPAGAASSVGSLPHDDAVTAAAFVLRHQPELPAAPQLPNRHPAEGMIAQAASGMAGVVVDERGGLALDGRQLLPVSPADALSGEAWAGLRTFLDLAKGRRGPVKVQLTGPVTLGLAFAEAGIPAPVAFTAAGIQVRNVAQALLASVKNKLPAAVPVVVLDEPGLTGMTAADFPLAADAAADLLSGVLATLDEAVAGIHCCGPTDWRVVLQAGPDLLSIPVECAPRDGTDLGAFLDRGGLIAWGAVPTDRPLGRSIAPHWRRLIECWANLSATGCDPALLRYQALVTPACGLARHGVEQVPHIIELVRRLADRVRDEATAGRLGAGA